MCSLLRFSAIFLINLSKLSRVLVILSKLVVVPFLLDLD